MGMVAFLGLQILKTHIYEKGNDKVAINIYCISLIIWLDNEWIGELCQH